MASGVIYGVVNCFCDDQNQALEQLETKQGSILKNLLSKSGVGIALLVAALVAGVLWGSAQTQSGVERAVRHNFVAAGMLSKLQVEGEKMRRYEKEMFIYVADAPRRNGYMKEHDAAYTRMLALLGGMLLPSSPYFNDAERRQILGWKEAAVFYAGEMALLARKAEGSSTLALTPEQRVGLTVQYNDAIRAGKDRFRELLGGTDKLRLAKEESAQQIAADIEATFLKLRTGVLVGGLALVAAVLLALRRGPAAFALHIAARRA